MRLLSVVKPVPDSRANLPVRPDGSGVDTASVKFVCDPFDEFGLEQAVQLREGRSDVEQVAALAVGGPAAVDTLRHAVALGADRAIHVELDTIPLGDELLLARLVAAAIRSLGDAFDLVLCGKQNIDNDAGEFGPALAELLDLPHVGAITTLQVADDGRSFRAHRRIEGAEEIVDVSMPALVTCEKGLVEPRHPPLPRLMKAKKHPIERLEGASLRPVNAEASGVRLVRLSPPPPRPPCTMITGEPADMARELVRRLREEAGVI